MQDNGDDIHSSESSNSWREILPSMPPESTRRDWQSAKPRWYAQQVARPWWYNLCRQYGDLEVHMPKMAGYWHAVCTCSCSRTDGCISHYCSEYFTTEFVHIWLLLYFTTECYRLTYLLSIFPIPDAGRHRWIVPVNMDVAADTSPSPCHSRRQPGRPKEKPGDPRITVKRAVRCGNCQVLGHNKQTCKASL